MHTKSQSGLNQTWINSKSSHTRHLLRKMVVLNIIEVLHRIIESVLKLVQIKISSGKKVLEKRFSEDSNNSH